MSYRPRTPRGIFYRDAILAALLEHGALSTTELCARLGSYVLPGTGTCDDCRRRHPEPRRKVSSADVQPTMTQMLRHREIDRWRRHPSDLWVWQLGPCAPTPIDTAKLDAMLSA